VGRHSTGVVGAMQIDIVFEFERLVALKGNWDAVYDADPDATYFLSSSWITGWLKNTLFRWFILAAKPTPESDYVAFFPLRISTEQTEDGTFYDEIGMGGGAFSDYAGLICDPAYEAEAIAAFADHLLNRHWAKLQLDNIPASDRRIERLLKRFPRTKFKVADKPPPPSRQKKRDNSTFPYITLPGDWETYLASLGSNRRADARRVLRRLEKSDDLRITHASAETFDRDLAALLTMWETTWAPEKGEKTSDILTNFRIMLTASFEAGTLFLPVLWQGEKPIGALGTYIDRSKKRLLFSVAGRDESVTNFKPGLALHFHSIKWAIENGFATYDFLMGNETYKYRLGGVDRRVSWWTVSTRTGRNLGDWLDPSSYTFVFERSLEAHRAGNLDQAERGYRQILASEPEQTDTLFLLAQLQAVRWDLDAAVATYRTYLGLMPENDDAWSKLGECLMAQGDAKGAAECLRKVVALDPSNQEARAQLLKLTLGPNQAQPAAAPFALNASRTT
jgi:CelD/BcsL family acetyltransferase involved in cellulose biosynthesis